MQLPVALLNSLEGINGFDRQAFEAVHARSEVRTSIRLNPAKTAAHAPPLFEQMQPVPWTSQGYYLPERPAFVFDPLWHAGAYYVQEASSMFLEQALRQTTRLDQPLNVLDLCAAPGGKSTLLQSLISADSLLVTNEVIKSRAAILEENMTRWGAANVVVTNNDPQDFQRLPGFFDVVVVDAPCSGSGLFRRDERAIDEWSPDNVALCAQRQERILADIYPALKKDGILIYSTCSYSVEEDEQVLDWLLQQFELESLPLDTSADSGIVEVTSPQGGKGYRFYPDKIRGEGFFIGCFRKKEGDVFSVKLSKKITVDKAGKAEKAIIEPWLKDAAQLELIKQHDQVIAIPAPLLPALIFLQQARLYIRKAGVQVGKVAGKDLVPAHALAMSALLDPSVVAISLKQDMALQYLRKEEVTIEGALKGWALVQYKDVPLGWVKVLPNRVNNYYPAEWRLLKTERN